MRLCKLVRSMPKTLAAAETFQDALSSARRQVLTLSGLSGFLNRGPRTGLTLHANFNGNGRGSNLFFRCKNGHAFHHVAQFAGISGPRITFQQFEDFIVHLFRTKVVAGAEVFQEIKSKRANVLRTLAEGRHLNRHNAHAIVKVFSELALRYHRL